MLDALIAGGARLIGGFLGQQQQKKNEQLQREFAQNSVSWRVADAKRAGIHPLYALGAPTFSPAVSSSSPMGDAIAGMGQDISRSMNATASQSTRDANVTLTNLAIQRAGLQNELLKTEIASRSARLTQGGQRGPAMPIDEVNPFRVPQEANAEGRPPVMLDGTRIRTDPGTSPAKAFEDWLGDDVFSPGFLPNLFGAAKAHWGPPATWPSQMVWAVWDRLSAEGKAEFGNFERFLKSLGGGNRRNTGGR